MTSACPFSSSTPLPCPVPGRDRVGKDECCLCFGTACHGRDGAPGAVCVCTSCWQGFCPLHFQAHSAASGHHGAVVTRKTKRAPSPGRTAAPPSADDGAGGPAAKAPRLVVLDDRDEWDSHETAVCACAAHSGAEMPVPACAAACAEAIRAAKGAAAEEGSRQWELQLEACEHALCLQQVTPAPALNSAHLVKCDKCDLTSNLWLCLSCGKLHCGRRNFDGTGGNGHALEHGKSSGHSVVVKMGTITAEGKGDVYCYGCDDERIDPELPAHLRHFSIRIDEQVATEKTLAELNHEINVKFDFSMTSDQGVPLQPLCGPGLVGLENIGNSCYMASAVQASLVAFPQLGEIFLSGFAAHAASCRAPQHSACYQCQMHKLAEGLLTPHFARWSSPEDHSKGQVGVAPHAFKALVAAGHQDFSTSQQQDAAEFLGHFARFVERAHRGLGAPNPFAAATYTEQTVISCSKCEAVSVQRTPNVSMLELAVPLPEPPFVDADLAPVPIEACLNHTFSREVVTQRCGSCSAVCAALKTTAPASAPETLVVRVRRFVPTDGFVPRKVDVKIVIQDSDEVTLPVQGSRAATAPAAGAGPGAAAAAPQLDEGSIAQLTSMGFSRAKASKALRECAGSVEAAMEWIFAHMDDPDDPEPSPAAAAAVGGAPVMDPEAVAMLMGMGFDQRKAEKALRSTGGDLERAVEWVFNHPDDDGAADDPSGNAADAAVSADGPDTQARYRLVAFISHKGTSVHAGHYVAYARTGPGSNWVLFNDSKVADSQPTIADAKAHAYVYLFRKC
jgi:ubiquitin carboxyl-terminal hydrolase 5/13